MKKKNQKKTSFAIKELYSSRNAKTGKIVYKDREIYNISPYSMTGTGFNGKEISWKEKANK